MPGLASAAQPYLDPNWSADPNANPYALASLPPPQPSVEQAPPPAAPAPPPQGVAYVPGQSAPQPSVPPAQPMYSMAPDEAIRLARQGAVAKPAGFTPTTRSESVEGRAGSPELDRAVADKLGADADAQVAQYNADSATGAAQNEAQRRLAIFDAAQARDAADRAQATQAKLAGDRDHIQKLMVQSAKPDQSATDEYWGSKSTFSKIATALSMAMKGFVFSGYGRGQDPGQWLNQQISQVVQEQQNRAAKTREAVGDAKDLYAFNKQALGDDERTKLATELALRNQVASTLDRRIAEATADPQAQLRGAQLKKTLADQNEATLEQFWDKTAEKHTTSQDASYHGASLGAQDPLALLERAVKVKKAAGELSNDTEAQNSQLDMQGKQVGLRKTVAETEKAEAEAKAATGKAGGVQALGAQDVQSTAYDPRRLLQGTEAHGATIGQAGYNATLQAIATKQYGARGARDIIEKLKIEEGDTAATIAMKRQKAAQLFGAQGAGAIPGVTAGVAPGDEGEP